MKIGILFGGPSREREISFAGGRTVYDNLNKSIFTPVPIFIDSHKNFIRLDWEHIYKGSIRDFYPPVSYLPASKNNFQIYIESLYNLSTQEQDEIIDKIGTKINPGELDKHIDFAFLALHGYFGEDGSIQGLMESLNIPYSGSGILACAIGMDKAVQKTLMRQADFDTPDFQVVTFQEWMEGDREIIYKNLPSSLGQPYVVRPANQGSSIGVSIIHEAGFEAFENAVNAGFFVKKLSGEEWLGKNREAQVEYVRDLVDIKTGVGLPLEVNGNNFYHPEELLAYINGYFTLAGDKGLEFIGLNSETKVVVEGFIDGRELSCIVIRGERGESIALPPTEILKGREVFDYRSKYLAGLSRKVTPIELPDEQVNAIRKECERLFDYFGFNVYARIDGFITEENKIFLNDPNTTSGMLPSSFFFHQAAEIGLNPSQFLTYLIRTSIAERKRTIPVNHQYGDILEKLDSRLKKYQQMAEEKIRIAVVLGGYSTERHISVESGRNIYEKLASSKKYEPIPIFLTGNDKEYRLFQIPINLLLKDNADDIRDKILNFKKQDVVEKIKGESREITGKYTVGEYKFEPEELTVEKLSKRVDGVFIALHGRPGEDGTLQQELEKYDLPYNGSGPESSKVTIDKYETTERLKAEGYNVAKHTRIYKDYWKSDKEGLMDKIEKEFGYPFIAKPVDDGCSSAVKKIDDRKELDAFMATMFRDKNEIDAVHASVLELKKNEEFPVKEEFLIEEIIGQKDAKYFMEVTGGMVAEYNEQGEMKFEVFEPSETLAGEEVLSLEEKFLAGQGQNITPARFGRNPAEYQKISSKVKEDLKRVAQIVGVEGYCRIDAFVRVYENGEIETIVIEVNSLPGMTPATCIFHQAALNDHKPFEFIDKILEFGFEKNKAKI